MADDRKMILVNANKSKKDERDLHVLNEEQNLVKLAGAGNQADEQQLIPAIVDDEEGRRHVLIPNYVSLSEMNTAINQFKHVDHRKLKTLSATAARKIKANLIAIGHWGDNSVAGQCPCLNTRLHADDQALAEAGIGRASILHFFETIKTTFDMWTTTRDRSDVILPMPDAMLIVQGSDMNGVTKSIRYKRLSEIAGTIDLRDRESMAAAFESPSHTIVDTNHTRVSVYLRLMSNDPPLKARLEKYTASNIKSRNHFIKTVGHSNHVISLLRAPAQLVALMPDRKNWTMWRETMILVTEKLLVYRIEWGGAEKCPIYSHFEKKYIGYRRGNVDWFICNVVNGSQVWVPDLVVYQIGLFGFLQGLESPYRLDLKAYVDTVVSSYVHDPLLKM
jgi:hypothetical protein